MPARTGVKRDYYEVLGIARGASADDVKGAYRRLAMQFHPDRVPTEQKAEAEERFKDVSEAYEVLADEEKRRLYDEPGHAGVGQRARGGGQGPERAGAACDGAGVTQEVSTFGLDIPVGADDGMRLRLAGRGEADPRGGPARDLYPVLHVRSHPVFPRPGGG